MNAVDDIERISANMFSSKMTVTPYHKGVPAIAVPIQVLFTNHMTCIPIWKRNIRFIAYFFLEEKEFLQVEELIDEKDGCCSQGQRPIRLHNL